jgi:four helix bundle protein
LKAYRASVRDYHSLVVWKRADEIVLRVYALTTTLPPSERFGLVPQMQRAAVSIASNIAEAAGRTGRKDGARFLSIASGSASELEYQAELVGRLGLVEPQVDLLALIAEVQGMLLSLSRRWRQDPAEPRNL